MQDKETEIKPIVAASVIEMPEDEPASESFAIEDIPTSVLKIRRNTKHESS